jgi:hypothetical protein
MNWQTPFATGLMFLSMSYWCCFKACLCVSNDVVLFSETRGSRGTTAVTSGDTLFFPRNQQTQLEWLFFYTRGMSRGSAFCAHNVRRIDAPWCDTWCLALFDLSPQIMSFAENHDLAISQCLSQLLQTHELPIGALAGTPTTRYGRLRSHECIPPGHACLLGVMGWRLASFGPPSTTSDNHHPRPFRTACDSPTTHPGGARRTPKNPWTWVGTTQLATTDRATASTCPRSNFRWANPTRLATARGSPYQHSRTWRHLQQPRPSQSSYAGFTN